MPVEGSGWAYELSLYVHLNPVMRTAFGLDKTSKKAESRGYKTPSKQEVKDRLAELRKYQWSSYRAYAGYCDIPEWLQAKELLRRASRKKNERVSKYRDDIKYRLVEGVSEPFQERLKSGLALGTEKFLGKIKELAGGGDRETKGKKVLRRRIEFKEVVEAVEKLRGLKYEEMIRVRGDWGKPLLIFGVRLFCGMTLAEVGGKIQNMDYAAVAMSIRRFEKKAEKDRMLKTKIVKLREMLNVKT